MSGLTGEAGAAHLLLPLRDIPVQQRQGERGAAHAGADVLCVVTAAGGQQGLQKPAVLLPGGGRTYPAVFLLPAAE